MKALDLFGNMTEMDHRRPRGYCQWFKYENAYRLSEDKTKSCKTCDHCLKMDYHNKNYYKCELIGVSHSEATDIRLKMVCNKFTKE